MNNISFYGKFHFLQNQSGLNCAYCGKPTISEAEFKKLDRQLQGKRGSEIAQILMPYKECFPDNKSKTFNEILSLANDTKFQKQTFKEIAMHVTTKDILSTTPKETLKNLLTPVMYSVEHVCPRTVGGKNGYFNYLPMHISCNSDRSATSYGEIIAKNPQFVENIKKSLHQIQTRVQTDLEGKTKFKIHLPDDYISSIKETIQNQGIQT